ncbi:hypothetical protein [Brumimicrobium mesophilum]|uniref:hypothetical protein n=1 Tax=Brumimicrobium mesophilum TaxID=392717 RepID=UPI000D143635|nr:hypothetical protein [Brumimicrobium mesophilum]
MKRALITLALTTGLLFGLSGCFELIEDTTLNSDGTGTYKLTVNLSASTTKVNSMMAMDSIKGSKVPSRSELKHNLQTYLSQLEKKEGISNVTGTLNTETWIVNLSLDFESLTDLKKGLISMSEDITKKPSPSEVNDIVLNFSKNVYERKIGSLIPENWQKQARESEDFSKLNEGKCVFIQRFDKEIENVNSDIVRIAKSKKATMLQLSPLVLVNAPEKLDYIITIKQ